MAAVGDSYPVFERLREFYDLPELVFQSGVPSDLDLAMFTLGPTGALRHRRPFTEATVTEIRGVRAIAGPATVFQLELPVELVLLAKVPRAGAPSGGRTPGRPESAGSPAAAPAGSVYGLHLCLGDMNNKAFGTMRDVAPLVELTNAIVRRWPGDRRLSYVHAPFAAADQPATTDPTFYAPLDGLHLPSGTRFAAGFAHESQSLDEQLRVRGLIEERLGHPVDISAACGLGRRTPEAGLAVLHRTAELLDE